MMQPYKKLFTYWYSVLIYDLTVEFCNSFILSNLDNLSSLSQRAYARRLADQMVGAARSGKQNIIEGSEAMQTSLKSCIKLTGVAKASFEELIGDLEDFLRQRKLPQWEKGDSRVVLFRSKASKLVKDLSNLDNLRNLGNLRLPASPEEAANLLLTLCHQETYLLYRQVEALKNKHMKEGGLTEALYRKRTTYHKNLK